MDDLIKEILQFRDERDWKQFHTPDNLAKSIVIEASELLENFQWGIDWADRTNVGEELADVMIYALMMCDRYGFDVKTIIRDKIAKNGIKYPKGNR
jgi:dCTP diphosphatase